MTYSNEFLQNFRPILIAVLNEKKISMQSVELEVIDEESEDCSLFEPANVRDVLEQISDDLNFLTIYTQRPAYFAAFAETMYEENGLIVSFLPKTELKTAGKRKLPQLVLDFEWEGKGHEGQMCPGRYYIPIHKRPWQRASNLDIIVPFGYNTVIVKDIQNKEKRSKIDRFEAAFYN